MSDRPSLPQEGRVISVEPGLSFGRIELADGTEVKFGVKVVAVLAAQLRKPEVGDFVGMGVTVEDVDEHPLGGWRAKVVHRNTKPVSYESFGRLTTAAEWEREWARLGMSPSEAAWYASNQLRPAAFLVSAVGEPALGTSKLGGAPDLGPLFAWPEFRGEPHW